MGTTAERASDDDAPVEDDDDGAAAGAAAAGEIDGGALVGSDADALAEVPSVR